MAGSTWAIGDIQGCFATFEALLARVDFRPTRDRLWLAGDLVNRGPASLEMLRWARRHDACVTAVLGNHDLHLLGCAAGFRKVKGRDTLQPILDAADRDALLYWLRHRPLLVRERGFTMMHAGLAPSWSLALAQTLAAEVERSLRGPNADALFAGLRQPTPRWTPELTGLQRELATLAVLTRMRACGQDGDVTAYVGPPQTCPVGERPWYTWRRRQDTVLFGHWAAHGHQVGDGWVSLDSGAVWGQTLTAWRLEDGARVQVPSLFTPPK